LILASGGNSYGSCGCSWKRPTVCSENKTLEARIASVIYGLSVQKFGHLLEFRCIDCLRSKAFRFPMIRELGPTLRIYCETHPENFGEWGSEAEMERDKRELASRIGLL
jgi:hypothetical protein